jgi:hypothetical protein
MNTSRHKSARLGATLLCAALTVFGGTAAIGQGAGPTLNSSHPDTYTVKSGDTLWDISGVFLRDPWYWPEIWYVNPQVENPHLIYPGDVLTLVYVDGQPQIRSSRGVASASGTERLSPRIREQALSEAVETIPYEKIAPFLSKGMVLERDEIRDLPHIVALRDRHLVGATGNDAYVRGDVSDSTGYSVVHIGSQLRDPDDGDVLGYEGIYVADGDVRRVGDPSTVRLTQSQREAMEGDRLVAQHSSPPLQFQPRPPGKAVEGTIMHVVDGVTQIGQYQVVIINRGSSHGLEPGHVLSVWQSGDKVWDRVDSRLFDRKVQLPDEPAGTLMVFKTYERLSYGLVMQAEGPIHTLDKVRNPS